VKRSLPLIAWLLAAPAVLASSVEFEAALWSPDLGGVVQVDGNGAGTAIDLGSDLGFGSEQLAQGRLVWRPTRRTSVRLSFSALDFAADAQLQQAVTFGGTTFALDASVTSRLQLDYGGVGFAWQPLSSADGRFRLGPLVEARGIRGEAEIRALIAGIVPLGAREEFELGFAAAGLVLDLEPTRKLHLHVEWKTAVGIDEGDLTDAEVGLRYYPLEALALTAGYRRLELDSRDSDELFDLELDGPFFGAVLRF
jgi:hypothetical protein